MKTHKPKKSRAPEKKITISSLAKNMNERFDQVDARFVKVDERFDKADAKSVKIDERLERGDKRFKTIDDQFQEVLTLIKREGEETRHHFDVVAEKNMSDMRDMFNDRTSQHSDKLENHEHRILKVESMLHLAA